MSVQILRPGMLTTVQDSGRHGQQRFGVAIAGAMDSLSLRVANLLVENAENAAGMEITLLGPELLFEQDSLIAICGGEFTPQVAGVAIPLYRPVAIGAGSKLTFGSVKAGCRAYLSVAGGIDVLPVLGSRSTYLQAGFGGYEGRALQAGDTLPLGPLTPAAARLLSRLIGEESVRWSSGITVDLHSKPIVHAIRGAEYEWLTAESQQRLWEGPFVVSPESNRMGYRLNGGSLALRRTDEILSTAVAPGTIQLPAGGQPILLMRDCAPTGGYAKIAHVASCDLPHLAQLRPGDSFQLREISLAEAHRMVRHREEAIQCLKASLKLKLKLS